MVESQEHLLNCERIHGDNPVMIDISLFQGESDMSEETVMLHVQKLNVAEEWS